MSHILSKKGNIEILRCYDGQVWVTGGHFTYGQIREMEATIRPELHEWHQEWGRIKGVKHIWYRRGFLPTECCDEPRSNGWCEIPGGHERFHKRKWPATELLFMDGNPLLGNDCDPRCRPEEHWYGCQNAVARRHAEKMGVPRDDVVTRAT